LVAIALSGRGAKGAFEVGAVRYLFNQNIRRNILCGVSVGAINAIKLAEGENPQDPDRLRAGAPDLSFLDVPAVHGRQSRAQRGASCLCFPATLML
jgi:hypothetical protein